MVTMNALENGMEGDGITLEDSAEIAKIYEKAGADALQVRVYEIYNRACYWLEQYYYPEKRDPLPPGLDFRHKGVGAFNQVAEATKKAVSIPVMTPGKWDFHLDFAEEMIRKKHVDIVGIVRGLFADCELPNKIARGKLEDIAPCTACLTCLTGGMFPVRCRINKFLGGETEYFTYPKLAKKKKVLVAGAGPAGLEAARVSALRGHEVVLYSKETFLGGLMNMANIVKGSYPEDIRKIVNYFTVQLDKLDVRIVKGKEVTPGIVEAERPDVAILATGALLSDRAVPGADEKLVVSDLLLRWISNLALRFVSPAVLSRLTEFWMPIGKSVLIMGGDIKGLQLAEFLLKRGRKVTVVTDEAPDKWGEGLPNLNNYKLNVWFAQKEEAIKIIRGVQYREITKKGLVITTDEGEERLLTADSIMPVFPLRADEDLHQTLQGKVPEVFTVGACKNPKALIVDAIADASEVASSI
jgi:thioredoxin reductase